MNLPLQFQMVETLDGSPSLAWTSENGRTECMHSRHGALTESLYIYNSALQIMTENRWPLHVLSMGLGLAYNEMIFAAHVLALGRQNEKVHLESFESQEFLIDSLGAWLNGQSTSPLFQVHSAIAELVSQKFSVSATELRELLNHWLKKEFWLLQPALTPSTPFTTTFSAILYDAYSAKSNPELWDQAHLESFLDKTASANCVFTTYAATGNLNRALKSRNFNIEQRAGFAGKRESTFAIRRS